jgi:NADP-dependent 3-hydroxy acid dehydrogenase YdfG
MQSRHYRSLDLSNARVLITGATSGMGRAMAFRFAELNCKLYLIGRNDEKLQKLGQDLLADAHQHMHSQVAAKPLHNPELIKFDVTDVHRIPEIAKAIGPVDILVNNAGCKIGCATVDDVKTEDMITMVNTNMLAPMALVAAFAPMMKQQGSGHIINIASTAAWDVYAKASVYCATKSALNAYSVAARHDLLDTPVRVTSISPGLVHSELHIKCALGDDSKVAKTFENILPLTPEDIADQVVYACTRPKNVQIADVASYCTNQSHSCPGGIQGVARMGPNMGGNTNGYQELQHQQQLQQPMGNYSINNNFSNQGFQHAPANGIHSNGFTPPGTPPRSPPSGSRMAMGHGRDASPGPGQNQQGMSPYRQWGGSH